MLEPLAFSLSNDFSAAGRRQDADIAAAVENSSSGGMVRVAGVEPTTFSFGG